MYSGSRAAACSRTAAASCPAVRVIAGGGDHVGDQPPVAGHVLPDGHRGLATPGQRGQHRLDLAGLDPEPADLDLVIGPPGEHQLPVGRPAGQVPGPVHPLPARPNGHATNRSAVSPGRPA